MTKEWSSKEDLNKWRRDVAGWYQKKDAMQKPTTCENNEVTRCCHGLLHVGEFSRYTTMHLILQWSFKLSDISAVQLVQFWGAWVSPNLHVLKNQWFWYQKVHKTCPCSKSKKQQYYLLSLWSFCRQHHSIMQFWYQNHWFSRVYAALGKIACSKSYFFGFSCRLVSGVEVVKPAESMHFWGEKSSQSKWIPSLNILSFHLRIESIHLQNWNMRTRIKHWYLQC